MPRLSCPCPLQSTSTERGREMAPTPQQCPGQPVPAVPKGPCQGRLHLQMNTWVTTHASVCGKCQAC